MKQKEQGKFNYRKAESDLYQAGCRYSEDLFYLTNETARNRLLREYGLKPEKYTTYSKPKEKVHYVQPKMVSYEYTPSYTPSNTNRVPQRSKFSAFLITLLLFTVTLIPLAFVIAFPIVGIPFFLLCWNACRY